MHFLKIAYKHIIFDSYCFHHLDSLSIFGVKTYDSRQLVLLYYLEETKKSSS